MFGVWAFGASYFAQGFGVAPVFVGPAEITFSGSADADVSLAGSADGDLAFDGVHVTELRFDGSVE